MLTDDVVAEACDSSTEAIRLARELVRLGQKDSPLGGQYGSVLVVGVLLSWECPSCPPVQGEAREAIRGSLAQLQAQYRPPSVT